jgi:transketolase
MRDLFLDVLRERAVADSRIMLITADLGFKVLDRFREELPRQFLNIGIAEQNMIGVATNRLEMMRAIIKQTLKLYQWVQV